MNSSTRAPSDQNARHEAELGIIQAALAAEGYTTRLSGPHTTRLPTLLVAFDTDDAGRDRTLKINIVPELEGASSMTLIQFYLALPLELTKKRKRDVMTATAMVNAAMMVGHFAVPKQGHPDVELICELVPLIDFHQEHFGDYIEGTFEDELSLAVLPEVIEKTR